MITSVLKHYIYAVIYIGSYLFICSCSCGSMTALKSALQSDSIMAACPAPLSVQLPHPCAAAHRGNEMAPGIRLIGGNMCRGERAGSGKKSKKKAEVTINCREECEEDIQNIQPWNPEDYSVFLEMCNEGRQPIHTEFQAFVCYAGFWFSN